MEPHSREPERPRARPPDDQTESKTDPGSPGQQSDEAAGSDELQKILGCFASGQRLAVLAALARGPRSGDEIAGTLNMGVAEVDEHLRHLASCGLVNAGADRQGYSLADPVEVHESKGELHIRVQCAGGMTVQGQLPMSTPMGRMLSRGWGG